MCHTMFTEFAISPETIEVINVPSAHIPCNRAIVNSFTLSIALKDCALIEIWNADELQPIATLQMRKNPDESARTMKK